MMTLGWMTLWGVLGCGMARAWLMWQAPHPHMVPVRVRAHRWK